MSTEIYLEFNFNISPISPGAEILVAQLGEIGFESFVETESGVTAYIQNQDWDSEKLEHIQILQSTDFEITYSINKIKQTNWNAEWEKNFQPITVDGLVTVRAPFHKKPDTDYDIIIEPKMSFGTGHHETTHMMIQYILSNDVIDKKVLDMGCGTGVLAILAEMKGAAQIDAIDNDNWCYINSLENVQRNNCKKINVLEGDASLLNDKQYHVVIANINRNILLQDISIYASCLDENGILLLSGFYNDDIPIIMAECQIHGLNLVKTLEQNNWVALKFEK